jgi:LPS-assembly protein
MTRALPLVLLCLLLPALVSAQDGGDTDATPAPAAEPPSNVPLRDGIVNPDVPLTIEADEVEYDETARVYRAAGNVILRQEPNVLHADLLILDAGRRELLADGHAVLTTPDAAIQADALHFHLDTELGVMARAEFVVKRPEGQYFLRGRRIEKIGVDRYLIYDGQYTTCDCGPDEADWLVTAEFIDVTFNGYAIVEHGRVYAQGLAVAYLPYGIFPAKVDRSTGFLWPETGWASDDGYRIGLPFYWNIAPHADATLYPDWYEKRGVKLGAEGRYLFNKRWYGQIDADIIQDREHGNEFRWDFGYVQQFNIYRQLYLRHRVNVVSDREYVNDFPRDLAGRYDRYLRSDLIVNNLWPDYDLNVSAQHWQNLTTDDNSYTWQRYPQIQFDAVSQAIGPLPLYWKINAVAVNFYRPKISQLEKDLDAVGGHDHPYLFVTDGRRAALQPELHATLNADQWVTFTPYGRGLGTFSQTNDRDTDRTATRLTGETGARLFTRIERPYVAHYPTVRGIKHQIEPAVEYTYRYEPDQETLPIFDGSDRLAEVSTLSYGLTNRLWMRLFNATEKNFQTFKLTDLRVLHGYDFAEAARDVNAPPLSPTDPLPTDRRPWLPWRVELETLATAGTWLDKIVVRSDVAYDTYLDRVSAFNAMGVLGSVRDDSLGVEYRYHLNRDGEIDVSFLSAIARINPVDLVSLDYLARYSFLDEYFIEQRYGVEFHSLQDCWSLRVNYERREIPNHETVVILLLDLTGFLTAGTAF